MKAPLKLYICAIAAAATIMSAAASPTMQRTLVTGDEAGGVRISNVKFAHDGSMMNVRMQMNLKDTKLKGDRVIFYVPMLVNDADTLMLNPVGLYGRTRWIQYKRQGEKPLMNGEEVAFQYSHRPDSLIYSESVPYADWMNNAELQIARYDYGCCRTLLGSETSEVAKWVEEPYKPVLNYYRPAPVIPKRRALEGSAYIEFPVDQTVIYPDYRRNAIELDSIMRTIDLVRNDPDAVMDTVWLKGFASPESPYSHNTDLAIGRTAALKKYLQNLYDFSNITMLTDYEPEDWAGLRRFVVDSNLANKEAIIELIDTDMDPDAKEARIKKLYPEDYRFMLQAFYPALRHTDYRVSYVVKNYTDPHEILNVMKTRPTNLDPDEFFTASSVLEPGSDAYNDVFVTAATLYPADPMVNLNAANSALYRGDTEAAAKYLAKSGDSADAIYARSVLAALQGNSEASEKFLQQALAAGVKVDPAELEQLREVIGSNAR